MTAPENSLSHKSLDIASWKEEGGRSEEEQQSERDAAAAVKGEERGANGQKTSFSLCHIEYIECIKRRTSSKLI